MFRVLTINGMQIAFEQHQNGCWKMTGLKDGESFEIRRSIDPDLMPHVLNALVKQPDQDGEFKELCQKYRKAVKATLSQSLKPKSKSSKNT